MNESVLKRQLSEATYRVVKSREPNLEAFGQLLHAAGSLLGEWTGQSVRLLLTAEGQTEGLDLVKPSDAGRQ